MVLHPSDNSMVLEYRVTKPFKTFLAPENERSLFAIYENYLIKAKFNN